MKGIPVAKEIYHLSLLSGLRCDQFKHILVAAKVLDPIENGSPREGHIYTTEFSDQHQAFDTLVEPFGISRKLDCDGGICYLVPMNQSKVFEEAARSTGLRMRWGVVVTPKAVLSYTVPENFTWLVTYIYFRSIPPVNDADLTAPGTSSGDFRSDDFDVNGLTKAWLAVSGAPITSDRSTSFTIFNKPLLLAFAGGRQVDVIVQRELNSIPIHQEVQTAMHGYLAPPEAYDHLAQNVSLIEGLEN